MGANRETKGTYYYVLQGRIAKRVKTPTEYSETRENKNGKTVHEEFYSSLIGTITGISVRKHEKFGDQYNLVFIDENDVTSILQLSGRDISNFMKIAPNISFTHSLLFSAGMIEDKSSIFIRQPEGENVSDKGYVRHFYNKENLPPPVQDARGNWNYTDQEVFLEEKFREIMHKVNSGEYTTDPNRPDDEPAQKQSAPEVDLKESTGGSYDIEEGHSDLPF